MQMNQFDSIVHCYEAFDYKNRLWIFNELIVGGELTQVMGYVDSEEFCKYSLYKILRSLVELHR